MIILQDPCKNEWLSRTILAEWVVISQDSGEKIVYLAWFRQNVCLYWMILPEWLIILQDSGKINVYLAGFWHN